MDRKWFAVAAVAVCAVSLARDIHVDPDAAGDGADTVKTIAKAVALAQPGDTVHLKPTTAPYRDSVVLKNRSGEPGRPITIDGHGATLTGLEPLNPAEWTETSPGLYRNDRLFTAMKGDDALISRIFFVFAGQQQRMNRTSKGPKADFKRSDDLAPGEWTFDEPTKTFFLRIAPGQSLPDAKIEIPMRNSGVKISGARNEHLVIRNLTATHFWNDGFNIHNQSKDLLFQNIRAIENGDDGISAHEACEYDLDGFVAMRNSTGVCNIQECSSKLNHLNLAGNYGMEFAAYEATRYELRNSVIDASLAAHPVVIMGHAKTNQSCHVTMENVLIYSNRPKTPFIEVSPNGNLTAKNITTAGVSWRVLGSADVRQSIIAGPATIIDCLPGGTWQADANLYDVTRITLAGHSCKSLPAYQQAVPQDKSSQWQPLDPDLLRLFLTATARPLGPTGANLPPPPTK